MPRSAVDRPLADLFRSVEAGDPAGVRAALAAGANIATYLDEFDDPAARPHDTLLLTACRNGHAEVVRLLIAAGEPLDGRHGRETPDTPVGVAAAVGSTDILNRLLQAGADPNGGEYETETPIHRAASRGHRDAVALLANRVSVQERRTAEAILTLRTSKRSKQDRALLKSAKAGDADGVTAALTAGVFVDATDNYGMTALHHAAMIGLPDIARRLLIAGAAVDAVGIDPNVTASYLAITYRSVLGSPNDSTDPHFTILRELIDAGADTNWTDSDGGSLLMAAAARPDPDTVRLLLKCGADPNRVHVTGWTPLMLVFNGNMSRPINDVHYSYGFSSYLGQSDPAIPADVVRLLLDAGADPKVRNCHGKTAMDMIRPRDSTLAAAAELLGRHAGRT